MSRPRYVEVSSHLFELVWQEVRSEPVGLHDNDHLAGRTEFSKGQMIVRCDPSQSEANQRDTLFHEVIHAVLVAAQLDAETDVFRSARMAERVVEVLSTQLLDTLRRNPQLVAYLMEGSEP